MPGIALICDSTADFPDEVRAGLDARIVPLNVHFGDETLRDHVDITPAQFLSRLKTSRDLPRTSQPSPALFSDAYEEAGRDHDAILVITLSSKLSGTYQSAMLGAQSAINVPPIHIVDSLNASVGLGLQVRRARELIDTGLPVEEIVRTLESERDAYHLIFFADTLEFLQRGGRIGKASQMLGSLLKIKPLLMVHDGEVVPYERTRSRSRAIEGLIDDARQYPNIERMAILHDGMTPADVQSITTGITDRIPASAISVSQYGPIIATHVGPGALGLCVFAGAGAVR